MELALARTKGCAQNLIRSHPTDQQTGDKIYGRMRWQGVGVHGGKTGSADSEGTNGDVQSRLTTDNFNVIKNIWMLQRRVLLFGSVSRRKDFVSQRVSAERRIRELQHSLEVNQLEKESQ